MQSQVSKGGLVLCVSQHTQTQKIWGHWFVTGDNENNKRVFTQFSLNKLIQFWKLKNKMKNNYYVVPFKTIWMFFFMILFIIIVLILLIRTESFSFLMFLLSPVRKGACILPLQVVEALCRWLVISSRIMGPSSGDRWSQAVVEGIPNNSKGDPFLQRTLKIRKWIEVSLQSERKMTGNI